MTTQTITTMAERVRQLGGGGLPEAALTIFDQYEQRREALRTDQKISDRFRDQQLAELEATTDTALHAARDEEVAGAIKALEQREGAVLAVLKGNAGHGRGLSESGDDQRERHFRASREATVLLQDLLVAQSTTEPSELWDSFEEAIESGKADRIRKLGPVVLKQLGALRRQKVAGADIAHLTVLGAYDNWRKANPSPVVELRAIRKAKASAALPIDARYQRARSHFKFGAAAQGMRL